MLDFSATNFWWFWYGVSVLAHLVSVSHFYSSFIISL